MKISQNAKKAIYIGTLCSIAYFAVYIARNALSAATPQMLAAGYTEAYIGSVSSLFFVFYAVGQLINGWIGDHIQAKWMISGGLLFAAVANALFPYLGKYPTLAMIIFAFSGFFLSMIYGPMTKVVAENTEPLHATRCSIGYTFASFFGSPAAGILASLFVWQSVFTVSSAAMLIMAVCVVVFFLHFERRGFVRYGQYRAKEKGTGNIKQLFKLQIVKFSLVSILTGIVRTSVVFWLPTYIAQYLSFTETQSTAIFTVCTFAISFTTFIAVFVYDRLGADMDKTLLIMFIASAIFFLLTYFVQLPALNIIFLVLAIMGSNGATTMLWSCYCPSLRDTGMVSSVTGFLDFLSYMAAAVANVVFANAVTSIGWGNLILVWLGLVVIGVIVSLPYRRKEA
jgi:sugar phosphate permease